MRIQYLKSLVHFSDHQIVEKILTPNCWNDLDAKLLRRSWRPCFVSGLISSHLPFQSVGWSIASLLLGQVICGNCDKCKNDIKFRIQSLVAGIYFAWSNKMQVAIYGKGLWTCVEHRLRDHEGRKNALPVMKICVTELLNIWKGPEERARREVLRRRTSQYK